MLKAPLRFLKNLLIGLVDATKKSLRPEPPPPPPPKYSFCESPGTHWNSPWHIRPLTSNGKYMGGGVDTLSLCGRKVAWDIKPEVNPHQLSLACYECRVKYEGVVDRQMKVS